MEHEGWDVTDKRWERLDYLWLISGEILLRVTPLENLPPIKKSARYSRSVSVRRLQIRRLSSSSLKILIQPLDDDCWEASVYSGTYWYGLYTGSPEEESDQTS